MEEDEEILMRTIRCKLCKEIKPINKFRIINANTNTGTCNECYEIIKEVVVSLLRDTKLKWEW